MVSLWPWKRDDNSPASFEKTLANLSGKINAAAGDLEGKRQGLRRFKGLWTLSSILVYLVYLIVAALAIGWRNWGAVEYSVAAAGPVVIYVVRLGVTTFYDFRISSSQDRLKSLQKQRDATVARLKEATKYDTTMQLLEKYGGGSTKSATKSDGSRKPPSKAGQGSGQKQKMTNIVPPATANIPMMRAPSSATGTPDRNAPFTPPPHPPHTAGPAASAWQPSPTPPRPDAEFAPNAFNAAPQYAIEGSGSSWYDRLMDVLLGEDEMNPKNRLALICQNCRLVNGQAPPGANTLEVVGRWRCSSCGSMNGQDPLISSLATENAGSPTPQGGPTASKNAQAETTATEDDIANGKESDAESDVTVYSDEASAKSAEGTTAASGSGQDAGGESKPRRSTRGRKKA